MSDSSRPYKSHLFNFVNRHSLRLRDRLGETFRHLKIAAEWGVQVLTLPFNWLFSHHQWDGPVLPPGQKKKALPPVEPESYPPVDQTFVNVMTVIEPWFKLPELTSEKPELKPSQDSKQLLPPPQIVLTADFFEQVRQRLIPAQLDSADTEEITALLAPTLPPSPLGQLVQKFKNSLKSKKSQDVIIQGLACLLENRQLVLTTTENDVLEVLSPSQQQTVQQAIASELAIFKYERRLQWALSQKRLGFINLVKDCNNNQDTVGVKYHSALILPIGEDSTTYCSANNNLKVTAPVEWFYQKLRWAEQVLYNFQCNPNNNSVIVPRSVPLPTTPLLRQLDYTVAHLEDKEIEWGQRLQAQLSQGLNTLRQTPLLEASIEKTGQIIQQVNLPDKLQTLKIELQEKLTQGLVPRPPSSLDSSHNLETTEPDPFQIQVLIQAAIAYFFGSSSVESLATENKNENKLLTPEENWLDWDDLFLQGTPHPIQALAPVASVKTLTKAKKPKSKALSKSPIPPSNTTLEVLTSEPDYLPNSSIKSDSLAATNQKQTVTAKSFSLSKPWEVELEAAFDWIETEGKAIGYHKHPLEWILEILDQVVLWLEEMLKKVWHWFHQQYSTLR